MNSHSLPAALALAAFSPLLHAQEVQVDTVLADGPLTVRLGALTVTPERPDDAGLVARAAGCAFGIDFTDRHSDAVVEIDVDGDGEADQFLVASPSKQKNTVQWSFEEDLELEFCTYKVALSLAEGAEVPGLRLLPQKVTYQYGEFAHGGADYRVALVDMDHDGEIGGPGDYWMVLDPAGQEARGEKPFNPNSMYEADEPVFFGDGSRVEVVARDGVNGLRLALHEADPGALAAYLHRRTARVFDERWLPRFEGEMAEVLEQRMEPGRSHTDEPIEWIHDLTLERALARAEAENKPLLVDFEADWCVWCKVIDYISYPDREVAAYIREQFVPVKINIELLDQPLPKQYEVRGYPTMVVIAPDGSKVDSIVGFSPPSKFLEALQGARGKYSEGR